MNGKGTDKGCEPMQTVLSLSKVKTFTTFGMLETKVELLGPVVGRYRFPTFFTIPASWRIIESKLIKNFFLNRALHLKVSFKNSVTF
jgi:hypothetical protein